MALHSRLSNTTSRLHRCDLGLAVGWSAGSLRFWGWTHGHDPGVPLWAGVAMVALGLWFPVFVLVFLLASFRFFGGGTVEQLYDEYHLQSARTTHGDEGSTYTLWPPGTVIGSL